MPSGCVFLWRKSMKKLWWAGAAGITYCSFGHFENQPNDEHNEEWLPQWTLDPQNEHSQLDIFCTSCPSVHLLNIFSTIAQICPKFAQFEGRNMHVWQVCSACSSFPHSSAQRLYFHIFPSEKNWGYQKKNWNTKITGWTLLWDFEHCTLPVLNISFRKLWTLHFLDVSTSVQELWAWGHAYTESQQSLVFDMPLDHAVLLQFQYCCTAAVAVLWLSSCMSYGYCVQYHNINLVLQHSEVRAHGATQECHWQIKLFISVQVLAWMSCDSWSDIHRAALWQVHVLHPGEWMFMMTGITHGQRYVGNICTDMHACAHTCMHTRNQADHVMTTRNGACKIKTTCIEPLRKTLMCATIHVSQIFYAVFYSVCSSMYIHTSSIAWNL